MATEWKEPMKWDNAGTEPSDSLKAAGFKAGDKPPASVFNYFLNKTGECIEELQTEVDGKAEAKHTHTLDDVSETTSKKIMTAAERTKLSGIATGANAYTLPTASSSTLGGVKTTSTVTSTSGLTACPIISGVPYYKDTNTTYSLGTFGVTATAAELNIMDGVTATKDEINKLDGLTATTTELNYVDGVTSNIQTQLDGKSGTGHTHSAATTSAAGYMSASDKTKLNGIATGAEVNQNAFANVTVGSTTISADAKSDTLTLVAGSNVTLTPDATNDKVTIAATNTTYSAATTSAAGLMSASDKSKLDGITSSADSVSFSRSLTSGTKVGTITINGTGTDLYAPTNTDTHYTTGLKVGASSSATANAAASNGSVYLNVLDNTTVRDSHKIVGSGATTVTSDANGVITISSTDNNTTYSAATQSAAGLMSAADKKKLDGVATGANAYSLPTASSSTLGGVKTTSTVTSTSGLTACPIISGVPYYKDTNTTYSLSSFGVTATAAELNILDGVTATATELNYVDGVTSNIQTQLNGKSATGHTHTMANVSETDNQKKVYRATASASDGATFTATVDGITALTSGVKLTIVPSMTATSTSPTLNVNSLGAKQIRRKLSAGTATRSALQNANTVYKDTPLELMYDGTYWVATQFTKPVAADLYGSVAVANGGTGATTAAAARTNLGAASTSTYTASISATWTADTTNGGYYQTVTVSGVLATDNPIADVVLGTDVDANALYLDAWSCITRITTAANSITLYANESAPATAFTVQLKVVR